MASLASFSRRSGLGPTLQASPRVAASKFRVIVPEIFLRLGFRGGGRGKVTEVTGGLQGWLGRI